MRSIVLIGFMGAGKTTVGKHLAERLGWRFLDTDELIEERLGKTIPQIFREEGEARFRDLETSTIRSLGEQTHLVIAPGGGAVKREENVRLLKSLGPIVYLSATAAELAQRLRPEAAHRPLLAGCDLEKRVRDLLAERLPLYERAADIVVDTTGLTPDAVCDQILAQIV